VSAPDGSIRELAISELVRQVADQPTAPGGGTVSGVGIALAAALLVKAARAAADEWDGAAGAAAQAQQLRRQAEELPDRSRAAFGEAVALLRSRTGGGERDLALREALERAADVPLRSAGIAASVATLAAEVAEQGRADLRPEAVTAGVVAEACCRTAAHLVEINLGVVREDARLVITERHVREAAAARDRLLGQRGAT
jgi:formiminotetrahydrofolate cyclodeaminase